MGTPKNALKMGVNKISLQSFICFNSNVVSNNRVIF